MFLYETIQTQQLSDRVELYDLIALNLEQLKEEYREHHSLPAGAPFQYKHKVSVSEEVVSHLKNTLTKS